MTRVAVFDDNLERRESLDLLISQDDSLQFVGAFANGEDAIQRISECLPDVVLMDIGMPKVNGIEATKLLKVTYPSIIVLMQTIYEDDDNLFRSLQAGASGYILKKTSPEKIIEAIKDAVNGGAPITPAMALKVLTYFQTVAPPAVSNYSISNRERQILKLLVDGLSYKMIASNQGISFHTVNSHVRNIYEKLRVHSMGEAISKAIKENLVN
jgi:DNA-binding NarL/FixJ family response regulator